MASKVVTSVEFPREMDQGTLAPESFRWKFLIEGDSWMDRSSFDKPSLPEYLARAFDSNKDGDALFINTARFGDTIENMGRAAGGDFEMWLQTRFNGWRFDGILISGGGNDLIDAARDAPVGAGILRDCRTGPKPTSAVGCIRPTALAQLFETRMDRGFDGLYNVIQSSQYTDIPVFLNEYDMVIPRNAPAVPGGRTWLYEAFLAHAVPQGLWQDLADLLFIDLQMTIKSWTNERKNVFVVPTTGTLVSASPDAPGSDKDWLNEIHPNKSGWQKLAEKWHAELRKHFP